MIGNLLQQARQDAAKIATAGGFSVSAVLSTPDNLTQATVTGLATGTWMVFDDMNSGKQVNSSSNSFDIPYSVLDAAGYPYLKNGRPDVVGHLVTVQDAAGLSGTFTISEQHPNNTLGLLICIISGRR